MININNTQTIGIKKPKATPMPTAEANSLLFKIF